MSGMTWNIIIGILTGIVSGLYTGFVMAKYSAFCQIRFEIIYICRNFHISATNENIDSYGFTNYADIANAACNFFYLKHKDAGDETLRLYTDITNTMLKVRSVVDRRNLRQTQAEDAITAQEAFDKLKEWQERSRNIRPSKVVIILPWGHL